MIEFKINEKVFYGKNGKPSSVLIDYKVFNEMLELIEDMRGLRLIKKRESEKTIKEKDFLAKFNFK